MTHLRGDIGYATAIELKQGYARGDVRPTEVVRGVLERIDAVNPRVNAFSVIMRDEAMAAAKQSERRLDSREAGPLE
jgi:aspartyl-tRNA(Asn)/glutamyl-tRNA(Gln) amidotransferase subunit A